MAHKNCQFKRGTELSALVIGLVYYENLILLFIIIFTLMV